MKTKSLHWKEQESNRWRIFKRQNFNSFSVFLEGLFSAWHIWASMEMGTELIKRLFKISTTYRLSSYSRRWPKGCCCCCCCCGGCCSWCCCCWWFKWGFSREFLTPVFLKNEKNQQADQNISKHLFCNQRIAELGKALDIRWGVLAVGRDECSGRVTDFVS